MTVKATIVVAVLLLAGVALMAFDLPTNKERVEAIGPIEDLSPTMKRALDPVAFEPMNEPGPHDWLANHSERGQSFQHYVKDGFVTPDKTRNKIYLLPIGKFERGRSPSLGALRTFCAAYFGIPTKLLEGIPVSRKLTTRKNPYTSNLQILTHDVLKLLKKKLPEDAFCILGITMEDLYPDPDWNFVFGMASLYERVGVFSFARYDPAFYGQKRGKDYRKTLLRRSCKVLAHETAHMFGLQHCIYFQCLVNGSNHLEESDSRPMHLCPVCLRKLRYNIGFDVVKRYENLLEFYRKRGLAPEAKWVEKRIQEIVGKTGERG